MLENIKLRLGITDTAKDQLLTLLISDAKAFIEDYTHAAYDEEKEAAVCEKIAVYFFNRMGTEGLNSESFSGVSYSYTDEIPGDIKRQLNAFRKVRVIR